MVSFWGSEEQIGDFESNQFRWFYEWWEEGGRTIAVRSVVNWRVLACTRIEVVERAGARDRCLFSRALWVVGQLLSVPSQVYF